MTRNICKKWLLLLFENDKNNTIIESYNEFKKTSYPNNRETLLKVIRDNDFIDSLIEDNVNVKYMESDLAIWEGM